ncbi:hypothetical protein BV25DRAFT_1820030 [Artomyces pyxidatus]|uniref:Uncharacterized protein n=1 Tax=Artomyces pyxidatus TaxID=48021 RepID=A0ACB8TEP5_9AGAM|nr:hypothetical protein BV25DRAFT_1820030 [Artomyces pyxidatus]
MSDNPPIPPRPVDIHPSSYFSAPRPPPVPPLPPNFHPSPDLELDYRASQPHFEDPLVAPRPHKVNPDLPAEVRPMTPISCSRD